VLTLVVVVCSLAAFSDPDPVDLDVGLAGQCDEVVIADSSRTPELTPFVCAIQGQSLIAQWKATSMSYRSDDYVVQSWRCIAGEYLPARRA
jgi:hypothetical protein